MILDVVARLSRLAVALGMRDGAAAPVLAAVTATGGAGDLLVGASAHERRVDVVMPYAPGAWTALGGDPATAAKSPLGIRARVDGDAVSAALLTSPTPTPREAVDELAPPAVRDAWWDYVDQFCTIADARLVGATRWLDGRCSLDVRYPTRATDSKAELYLLEAVDQLGTQLGITAAQRALWKRLHVNFRGAELALTTSCTASGAVSQILSLAYPEHSWEHAVRIAQGTQVDPAAAAKIPRDLGGLAGALASDKLQSLELQLGPHEPMDVVVWAKLAP
jgi:hypothetical protein